MKLLPFIILPIILLFSACNETEPAKFQIHSLYQNDAILLNTQTGQTWTTGFCNNFDAKFSNHVPIDMLPKLKKDCWKPMSGGPVQSQQQEGHSK